MQSRRLHYGLMLGGAVVALLLLACWAQSWPSFLNRARGSSHAEAFIAVRNPPFGLVTRRHELMHRQNEFNRVRRSATQIIKTPLVLTRALKVPGVSDLSSMRARFDAFDWLKKEVQVDWPGNSALLRVRMRRRTGDEAAIVDAVADNIVQLFGADEMEFRLGRYYEVSTVAERYRELARRERKRYQRHAKRLGAQSDVPVSIEIQSLERDLKAIDAMIVATSNERRWTVPLSLEPN